MRISIFFRDYLWWTYRPITNAIRRYKAHQYIMAPIKVLKQLENNLDGKSRIYYLGVTNHPNLGDLGQHYCICKWIRDYYPDSELIKFEAEQVVGAGFDFIHLFKKVFRPQDRIVFQSGYTTQDLGGVHNLMHEMIAEAMPDVMILMLPQTIFFQHEENKKHTAAILNKTTKMLFLARDFISYKMAKEMFPNVRVEAHPDIVTTLIGTLQFSNPRKGVCLCTRNDGEKLYSEDEIASLRQRIIAEGDEVLSKDTQSHDNVKQILANLQSHIESEIESYSHYNVTITDRYHGTIFSLCAGTPVIIIKTTDHKVTTGADWFKGVYDDYVYVANDLEEAFKLYKKVIAKPLNHQLDPYFKEKYGDKLKSLFEQTK